ncbi:MAG TPA: signal recognition particle-docking protein FtsY [Anaerolineae bacterium]
MFNFLKRENELKKSIGKTRESFLTKLSSFIAVNELSEEFWVRLEESLIAADVGAETTVALLDKIRKTAEEERWREVSEVMPRLEAELLEILYEAMPEARAQAKAKEEPAGLLGRLFGQTKPAQTEQPTLPPLPNLPSSADGKFPYVILVVGVNGSGKTTSIAKLAALHKASGRRVLLAAGDTFRAAAIDQLKIWGERVGVDVIAHQPGSDPAAVAFDAWEAARARNVEVLIVDTAGRLQTKFNLMQELEKTARVLKKQDPTAPQETLLVMDAVTGQNGLSQAREFKKTVPLSGLILTKLDGTAKGGIVFAIAKELKLPIKFIGTGEGVDDFAPFDPQEFVDDLLETDRT